MSVIRLFAGGAIISAVLGYFAAFNMVGLNFILPGRYSYPSACLLMLGVSVSIALVQANSLSRPQLLWALSGALIALLMPLLVFNRTSELATGYFIAGFVPCVVATGCLLAWTIWKNGFSLISTKNRFRRPLIIYVALLGIYGSAYVVGADPEYLRFLRQQVFFLPVVGVLSGFVMTIAAAGRLVKNPKSLF